MALLNILEFPDPRLRKVAKPVTVFDAALKKLSEDMIETMYDAPGIGLAATQVNVHKRLVVIDISENHNDPLVFINPKITTLSDDEREWEEGCLSVPGYQEAVIRPKDIRVNALDINGDPFEIEPDELLAVCIQHELDHLDGKLFVDYISSIKRLRIRKKLEKSHKKRA
ncbi:MAG: peptide deformylase [Pseudomonadales bacterium]|nr:peptide deformylase [Pseudomonadales bacterium]